MDGGLDGTVGMHLFDSPTGVDRPPQPSLLEDQGRSARARGFRLRKRERQLADRSSRSARTRRARS